MVGQLRAKKKKKSSIYPHLLTETTSLKIKYSVYKKLIYSRSLLISHEVYSIEISKMNVSFWVLDNSLNELIKQNE